MLENLFYCMCI